MGISDTNHLKKADGFADASADTLAPVVILVDTFLDENIGSAARAMLNFGIAELRLVNPQTDHLSEAARKRAAGAVAVLENAKVYAGLPEAVGDLHKVYATTARLRDMTQEVMSAGAAAAQAAEVAAAARAEGARQASGFLFGPERSGLTNAHLADVDCVVQIPTNPSFSSLNLAQAVNLVCYESWKAREEQRAAAPPAAAAAGGGPTLAAVEDGSPAALVSPRGYKDDGLLADKATVAAFLSRLEHALDDARYCPDPHKRDILHTKIRAIYQRRALTNRDVSTLQGVLSALVRQGPRSDAPRAE